MNKSRIYVIKQSNRRELHNRMAWLCQARRELNGVLHKNRVRVLDPILTYDRRLPGGGDLEGVVGIQEIEAESKKHKGNQ